MDFLGKDIPKLGFGLMRLPMIGEAVDIEQTKTMVDMFLKAGFTYFDTAYGYLNGNSEKAVKTTLVERHPRESFQLATKLPAWAGPKNAEEAKQMLYTSLERTGAGYFDYYLMHNCGDNRTKAFDDFKMWDFALEQREKGVLKHVGFSFHDKADVLDDLLTKHPEMEFVQLQINYADWNSPTVQSKECLEVAYKHNKPVIIMEPVKGGLLANPPSVIADILKAANPDVSYASWAMRFAASCDKIITVLSGMSNIEQMQDNLATMSNFKALDEKENAVVEHAKDALEKIPSIPCTGCQYCVKDCPSAIAIPDIMSAMNNYIIYENFDMAKGNYNWATRNGGFASKCIACGQCEEACPQHIDIIAQLARATETLEQSV